MKKNLEKHNKNLAIKAIKKARVWGIEKGSIVFMNQNGERCGSIFIPDEFLFKS